MGEAAMDLNPNLFDNACALETSKGTNIFMEPDRIHVLPKDDSAKFV